MASKPLSNKIPANAAVSAVPELAQARTRLLERLAQGDAPSLAIGVARGSTVLWQEALGWADREARLPATVETLYPVASVSKSLTATGTLALIGSGKLNLDQPVQPFLGEIPLENPDGAAGPVLVSHLLAHTSGIPHLWHYEFADRPETVLGRKKLIQQNVFLAGHPGQRYIYTNLGYAVLAEIIEKAGGAGFQQVMEQSVFAPLGMARTTPDAWVGNEAVACGYNPKGERLSYRYRLAPDGGAGFFASVQDLLRYARFHVGAVDAPAPLRNAAIARSLGERLSGGYYLRGWAVLRLAGSSMLLSDGEMAGGTAVVMLAPEEQLSVVVLCNATGGPTMKAAVTILSALMPGFDARFGEVIDSLEQSLSLPGELPTSHLTGTLFDGAQRIPVRLDFTQGSKPQFHMGGEAYRLEVTGWERGALQATVASGLRASDSRKQSLQFSLWLSSDGWQGIATEQFSDDRPGTSAPHFIVFRPV